MNDLFMMIRCQWDEDLYFQREAENVSAQLTNIEHCRQIALVINCCLDKTDSTQLLCPYNHHHHHHHHHSRSDRTNDGAKTITSKECTSEQNLTDDLLCISCMKDIVCVCLYDAIHFMFMVWLTCTIAISHRSLQIFSNVKYN